MFVGGIRLRSEEEIAKGFTEGIDCAMVTLHEIAGKMGISGEEAYRLAGCFGIGMMQGSVCGAISAGFIAIGYRYGSTGPDQMDQRGLMIAKREEFLNKFRKEFGDDITCPGIIKLDLRKGEDMKKAGETGVFSKFCPKLCRRTADIVIGLL